jgi:cellulose synthase/poly-beta-1,6-N-acetylglucosamine synthase-like glycosyltransferase
MNDGVTTFRAAAESQAEILPPQQRARHRTERAAEPFLLGGEARVDEGLLGAELAIVVPTLNEHDNIRPLLDRLERALVGERWEVVFVDDDSTDGTVEALREVARMDRRVRCLQRLGRRGLSSACVERRSLRRRHGRGPAAR